MRSRSVWTGLNTSRYVRRTFGSFFQISVLSFFKINSASRQGGIGR